jgi:hypothetical protein
VARAQAVKVGRVIRPQNDRLAIEHGALDGQRRDGIANASESLRATPADADLIVCGLSASRNPAIFRRAEAKPSFTE